MTSLAMTKSEDARGSGERALRWIGDLDHPFYSDERNRYVWYEASAIAFQFLFLSIYFVAGTMLLVVGSPALPYAAAMFIPAIITAVIFQSYLKANLAEYWPTSKDLKRSRGQIAALSGVVLLAGLIRASIDASSTTAGESFFGGSTWGVIAGAVAGLGVVIYMGRKQHKDESNEI